MAEGSAFAREFCSGLKGQNSQLDPGAPNSRNLVLFLIYFRPQSRYHLPTWSSRASMGN